MALTNVVIKEVGKNRIEGSFSTDGDALPSSTGTIAAPISGLLNVLITVPTIDPFFVGDVVEVTGIGPAGVNLVGAITRIPDASTIDIRGTRVTTPITAQPITVLPYLFIKHNVKRITLRNMTTGASAVWTEDMGYGGAWKVDAAGNQSGTTTDGFYVRGSIVYLHPSLYEINSKYVFSMEY
jgi:hypothetical protein